MLKSKVALNIAGMNLTVATDDDPAYVEGLAENVSNQIKAVMESNSSCSLAQAAVLVALDAYDELKKGNNSSENLRSQIKDYLEDAARARMEAEAYKRELDKLKKK